MNIVFPIMLSYIPFCVTVSCFWNRKREVFLPRLCMCVFSCVKWAFRCFQDSKEDSSAFSCPLCNKACQTQHQLTMHIRQVKDAFSSICHPIIVSDLNITSQLRVFKYVAPLRELFVSVLLALATHLCSFPHLQHNTDAGANDHSCSICGKCLSSASSLDRHMLVHSGERPYKCSVCGQTFTTNGNMHRSAHTHTSFTMGWSVINQEGNVGVLTQYGWR